MSEPCNGGWHSWRQYDPEKFWLIRCDLCGAEGDTGANHDLRIDGNTMTVHVRPQEKTA